VVTCILKEPLIPSEIPSVCHSESSEESPECQAYPGADQLSGWKFVARKLERGLLVSRVWGFFATLRMTELKILDLI